MSELSKILAEKITKDDIISAFSKDPEFKNMVADRVSDSYRNFYGSQEAFNFEKMVRAEIIDRVAREFLEQNHAYIMEHISVKAVINAATISAGKNALKD